MGHAISRILCPGRAVGGARSGELKMTEGSSTAWTQCRNPCNEGRIELEVL